MNKRLFIGIPVKSALAGQETGKWQMDRQINQNRMSWTKPENWHITLYFLGDTPSEKVPLLTRLIAEAFGEVRLFATELTGIGVFPDQRNPKVLWIGLQNLSPIMDAYHQLGELLRKNGFSFDDKPLKPHLTIARIKSIENSSAIQFIRNEYAGFSFGQVVVDRVVLFESILSTSGPVYKPLSIKIFPDQ